MHTDCLCSRLLTLSPLRQADDFARYCASSYALNCMNHTTGSAAMVEPLVRFLLAAL